MQRDLLREPRIYGVVLGMSVAKPAYRKTAPVVVRNNYCSGRRAAAITCPFTRSVLCPARKFSRNAPNHDIGIRLAAGDELRASELFLLFATEKSGHCDSLAVVSSTLNRSLSYSRYNSHYL